MEIIKMNRARASELSILICFLLFVRTSSQYIRFKPTPCPETFNYERTEEGSDRWYGDIVWKINQTINGVSFRITFDRQVQLLVSYSAESTTTDNRIFTGFVSDVQLEAGTEYRGRIMVKFDRNKPVPMLESIYINGIRACPLDPAILSYNNMHSNNNRPPHTTLGRPDPPSAEVTTNRNSPNSGGKPSSGSISRPSQGNNQNQGINPSPSNQGGRPTGGNTGVGPDSNIDNVGGYDTPTRRPTSSPTSRPISNTNTGTNQGGLDPWNQETNTNQGSNSGLWPSRPTNTNSGNGGDSYPDIDGDTTNNWNKPTTRPTKATTSRPISNNNNAGVWNQENENQGINQGGSQRPTGSNTNTGGIDPDVDNSEGGSNNWNKPSPKPTRSTTSRPTHNSNNGNGADTWNTNSHSTNANIDSGGDTDGVFHGGDSDNSNQGGSIVPCGTVSIANPLITNGQKTHHGQWPWHVALYKTEGINLSYRCGGSLISKNKVITAAHCLVSNPGNKILNFKSLVVYLGKYYLKQYSGETGVQTKDVSSIKINPSYNSSNYQGDLAILTLSSDAEFTNYVRPVCLWEATNSIDDIENREGVVAGWGFTEHDQTSEELRMATLPVVSTTTCVRAYPKFYAEYLSETGFCAGFRNGTGPCNGDSGGGLVFKRSDNSWYLRGIVSLSVAKEGLNFCDSTYYVIFTDTARYVEFIQKNGS